MLSGETASQQSRMNFEFPKLYTEFAKYYDSLESQYRDYELEADWLGSVLESESAKTVLDISCGTGNHVQRLAKNYPSLDLVATDASKQMVMIAKSKLSKTSVDLLQGDFLNPPFRDSYFDAAMCMYWSIAGLNQDLTRQLFSVTNRLLKKGGTFVFDTENADGIKEELLAAPFIDAFFEDEESAIIRANFSTKKEKDLVDWRSYYLIETGGVSELIEDKMNLRFYSKVQLETLLKDTGFVTKQVLSSGLKEYSKNSPTLYFIAEKE
jgi:ubiquinone/menaquinone biosynthesis C-methylase UbiE